MINSESPKCRACGEQDWREFWTWEGDFLEDLCISCLLDKGEADQFAREERAREAADLLEVGRCPVCGEFFGDYGCATIGCGAWEKNDDWGYDGPDYEYEDYYDWSEEMVPPYGGTFGPNEGDLPNPSAWWLPPPSSDPLEEAGWFALSPREQDYEDIEVALEK